MLVTRSIFTGKDQAFLDKRVSIEQGDNLTWFDTIASNFNLMVDTSHKGDLSIRQVTGEVPSLVKSSIRFIAKGVGDEFFGCEFGAIEVAFSKPCPSYA